MAGASGVKEKQQREEEHRSPFSEEPSGGRWLLAGLGLFGIFMLSIIGLQTRPGSVAEVAASGGWPA